MNSADAIQETETGRGEFWFKLRSWTAGFLFLALAARIARTAERDLYRPMALMQVSYLAMIGLLFFLRRPPLKPPRRVETLIAILSTLLPMLFLTDPNPLFYFPELDIPLDVVWFLSLLLQIWGALSLGRSFGIAPAPRTRVTRGAYRWMRHPIYSGYVIMLLQALIANFTIRNACVFAASTAFFVYRAYMDDKLLCDAQPQENGLNRQDAKMPGTAS